MLKCNFEDGGIGLLRHVVMDCILLKNTQVLLVTRAPHLLNGGKFGLVGGYLDRDETVQQAAAREILEESGYTSQITHLIKIIDRPDRPREDRQNLSFVLVAQAGEQTQSPDDESTAVNWYDFDQLPPAEKWAFDHFDSMQFYLKNKSQLPNFLEALA